MTNEKEFKYLRKITSKSHCSFSYSARKDLWTVSFSNAPFKVRPVTFTAKTLSKALELVNDYIKSNSKIITGTPLKIMSYERPS